MEHLTHSGNTNNVQIFLARLQTIHVQKLSKYIEMGQSASKPLQKCYVQAIQISAGFWEYSIPIQTMPETKVQAILHEFQDNRYNHFVINSIKDHKLITVYLPDESIFLEMFHRLQIPFELQTIKL